MVKVLFVCHGNICRSTMAEFIFRDYVEKKGYKEQFYIESAATSTEELGNGVYPPVKRILEKLGIDCSSKRARQIVKSDYEKFDFIIGMDNENMRNLNRFYNDEDSKIFLFKSFGEGGYISDPWYTRDFEATYNDVVNATKDFFDYLKGKNYIKG